jgi:transcriptional regulator with XRE-family HTH domain
MEASPPPPEAVLLYRARESAEITMADAARSAGITDTRWSQIERGHERRKGIDVPARAKAGTLARMARAIGISPERLESEGRRPDAADILREILSGEPAAAGRRYPVASAVDDPEDDAAARLFPGDTRHDRIIRNIWRLGQYGTSREDRLDMIEVVDPELAAALRDVAGRQSEAGLACTLRTHVQCNDSDTSGVSGNHRTVPVRHD